MIIPIRCFTCGKVIADKYDYYLEKVEEDTKKNKNETKHFDVLKTGHILDEMGFTRYCCRRHIISNVDMMQMI